MCALRLVSFCRTLGSHRQHLSWQHHCQMLHTGACKLQRVQRSRKGAARRGLV